MNRPALGSTLFFLAAPGVVAGVVPGLLTGWDPAPAPVVVRVAGGFLIGAGLIVLVIAFARFASEGRGTPAPVAPTSELVVSGPYRWVRNPMYLAVGAIIAGQGLLLGQVVLAAYLIVFAIAVAVFVTAYEEPTLTAQFGQAYSAYRQAVPAWLPRMRASFPARSDGDLDQNDEAERAARPPA